jgi:hypothetical protein
LLAPAIAVRHWFVDDAKTSGRGIADDKERAMQHDTTNSSVAVSAEEAAILNRFAERASEAANVPVNDDGTYAFLAALVII